MLVGGFHGFRTNSRELAQKGCYQSGARTVWKDVWQERANSTDSLSKSSLYTGSPGSFKFQAFAPWGPFFACEKPALFFPNPSNAKNQKGTTTGPKVCASPRSGAGFGTSCRKRCTASLPGAFVCPCSIPRATGLGWTCFTSRCRSATLSPSI